MAENPFEEWVFRYAAITTTMKKGSLLLVCASLAVVMGGCYWLIQAVSKIEWSENAASLEWLPPEASNITYISGYQIKAAEFDIELSAFARWCDEMNKPLEQLTEDLELYRWRVYEPLDRYKKSQNIEIDDASNSISDDNMMGTRYAKKFKAGDWFYEKRWSNGGGYTIGYNVKERRGYFYFSPR